MSKLLITMAIVLSLSGCATWDQIKFAHAAGCYVTTEEGRASIREKQNIKTDICGDLK